MMVRDIGVGDARLTIQSLTIPIANGGGLSAVSVSSAGEAIAGTVILPSTYGRRVEAFSALAATLALNGWRVIQFDLRNNEGASPGSIDAFCLLTMVEDIRLTVDFFTKAGEPPTIVATSLAARAVLRAARLLPATTRIGLILPVVHAGRTIDCASEARPYDKWVSGMDRDLSTGDVVDGFLVNRGFIKRAIDGDLLTAEGTVADLIGMIPRVTAVFSRDDDWIDFTEAEALIASTAARRLSKGRKPHVAHFVEGVSHELGRNPVVFREVMELLVPSLAQVPVHVRHPSFRLTAELLRTVRQELNAQVPDGPSPLRTKAAIAMPVTPPKLHALGGSPR